MFGYKPTYYGIYEDNNPARRLMVIANHDNDVAEYWEWSGKGLFPVDSSNEAYKLGVNYMLYGLTHEGLAHRLLKRVARRYDLVQHHESS